MLAFFIDHLPATIHVLLLSRAEPELPRLRWRARGELSELHRADLRFSPDEMAAFLHHLKQARRYLCQALSDAREINDEEEIADALLELAWLAFESRDLAAAEQQTHEALEAAQRLHPPLPELHHRAALHFARLQHERGETLAALEQPAELESKQLWT